MTINKYPGTCRCGVKVAAFSGRLHKLNDKWIVTCTNCIGVNPEVVLKRDYKLIDKPCKSAASIVQFTPRLRSVEPLPHEECQVLEFPSLSTRRRIQCK